MEDLSKEDVREVIEEAKSGMDEKTILEDFEMQIQAATMLTEFQCTKEVHAVHRDLLKKHIAAMMEECQLLGLNAYEFTQTFFGSVCTSHAAHLLMTVDGAPVDIDPIKLVEAAMRILVESSIESAIRQTGIGETKQ